MAFKRFFFLSVKLQGLVHVLPSLSARHCRHCTFKQVSEGRLNKAFYGPDGYAILMNMAVRMHIIILSKHFVHF